jgi:Domain of unknown function (DUF4276)
MKNKEKRLKIAILGEHPDNDAEAFRTLLEKRPYPNAQFDIPIRNLRGGQLDVPAAVIRQIKNVKREKSIDKFIIVRDLDGVLSEKHKVKNRDEWFQKVNQGIDGNGIFYLAIAETEALLLPDIETINKKYGTKLSQHANPINIADPKKELKTKTEKSKSPYEPKHCGDIMKEINFQKVLDNHNGERSFQAFISDLDDILK